MAVELLIPDFTVGGPGWLNESGTATNLHNSVDDAWGLPDDDSTYVQAVTESINNENTLDFRLSTPQQDGPFLGMQVRIRARKVAGVFSPSLPWTVTNADGGTQSPFNFLTGNPTFASEDYVDEFRTFQGPWTKADLTGFRIRLYVGTSATTLRITVICIAVTPVADLSGAYGYAMPELLGTTPKGVFRRRFVFPY